MKRGMKALRRVTTVGLALALAGCGASGALLQSTTGQGQDTKTEAAGRDAGTADLPTLRIAMMPFITSLLIEYIRKNKLDGKAGFKMDTIMSATGMPMNEILAAGLWGVEAMGVTAMTGVANYDTTIVGKVLEPIDRFSVSVRPNSPIAQAKGYNPSYPDVLGDPKIVEGATILLPIGTAQHLTTLKRLEKLGLGVTDASIVNMDTAQTYQALQANQCDTVALSVPTFFETMDNSIVRVGNLADLGTRYMDMIMANRKAVGDKQGPMQEYIGCVKEACKALNDDPDMAADLMVDFSKGVGAEANRESCISDLGRVCFITMEDWKDREVGNFARELGEFYISLGQLEPGLISKFNSNIVSDSVENGN